MIPAIDFRALARERPIFVLAASQRCGSTLIQRLLNSCPEIMVWGELGGYLNRWLQGMREVRKWERSFRGQRSAFLTDGYDQFLPNMTPGQEDIDRATTAHLWAMFGLPAIELNRPLWGFKEVRYDAGVARFLQDRFPGARFVHLTRNVVDCLLSLKRWEQSEPGWQREWTALAIRNWERINASFLEVGDELSSLLSVRYEDMIEDPRGFVTRMAGFLELPESSFDPGVFGTRLHNTGVGGSSERPAVSHADLDEDDRELLSSPSLADIARRFGYPIL